jgi:hypothetical protein
MKTIYMFALLNVLLAAPFARADADADKVKTASDNVRYGFVFSGEGGSTAKIACNWQTQKCMLKVEKGGKFYDGKAKYLSMDERGSELHLTSKEDGRVATLYVDGGKPQSITLWKTDTGKRLDLGVDDLKTEQFNAGAFYKASIAEQ